MRAERSWYHATLAGSFATLVAFAFSASSGEGEAVRGSWMDAAPPMVSVTALLGLALHGWRGPKDVAGKVLAAAAMGALATHALLALAVPLAPGETFAAAALAALEVAAWALLPAAVLVAVEPRVGPSTARAAVYVLVAASVLLAARLLWNAWEAPRPMRVGIAVSWTSFVVAAGWAVARLLLARAGAPTPQATPR